MDNANIVKVLLSSLLAVVASVIVIVVLAKNATGRPPLFDNSNDHSDLIRVTTPLPYDTAMSPLIIEGKARGTWFFEASFPVRILDTDGQELGVVAAQAQADWMTEDFVPFTAELSFNEPTTDMGMLVLEKANPSGLLEHADELRVPITFATAKRNVTLFYYNAEKDQDKHGNILCSAKGLVAVERQIPVSLTPIQDTIRLLLAGELNALEQNQGIDTEFPLTGLELAGANLKNNHLTLEFHDPERKTNGGACRASILWLQIEATAKQFPEVESVSFIPEDLFQP